MFALLLVARSRGRTTRHRDTLYRLPPTRHWLSWLALCCSRRNVWRDWFREGGAVRSNARRKLICRLLVEDACTSSIQEPFASRSERCFTLLSAKTLAHLHRQPR